MVAERSPMDVTHGARIVRPLFTKLHPRRLNDLFRRRHLVFARLPHMSQWLES
ncbi:hypothetical protein HD595_002889 [Nonomuraea roseoviolacea subsp. carminata]|uniref:Uncharacterized protein n=1 Tax=Nonomuraea roseoviolacea subsp. carminata TaxID=160689 RepID=A0ABT1JZA6_9ACTN|nr:hypothetical protein [Nonomuraea roseoviolacea subsp. carminata]